MMAGEIQISVTADVLVMYAMTERRLESIEQYKFLYIVEGELIVDVQKCGTCRPKTVILNQPGSHVHFPKGSTIRIRNNKMVHAKYVLLHIGANPSE